MISLKLRNRIHINTLSLLLWIPLFFFLGVFSYAQEAAKPESAPAKSADEQTAIVESLARADNVTLDFKEADIRNVLKIISYKAGVNIVTTPEVIGNVTIRLVDVPWEKALDVILKTYGFAYERTGNIITVAPIDKLTALKKQEVELAQVEPTITEVFNLKYVDAQDAKKALDPQLSPRGKITVLEVTTQAGWPFRQVQKGETTQTASLQRKEQDKPTRSKVLIVSDIRPAIDKIKEVIAQFDIMPQQVLIETRIMEVSRDRLRDIGFDWGTGIAGASSYATAPSDVRVNANNTMAGRNLASEFTPGIFNPKEGVTAFPGTYPYKAGLELIFKKIAGSKLEVILHALEEDVNTNTLSAPRIMTLNNQEASILIGTKYPILKSEQNQSPGSTSSITTITLDYYQDIGIQLNVVPQVCATDYVNMVIHPSVTSYTTTKGTNEYPVIDIRETETRVLLRDGETIVIGGLLKDVKSKENIGVPFLSKIPILGKMFTRETNSITKIDLLVFLTARIVKPGGLSAEEIAMLEERLDRKPLKPKDSAKNKK